MTNSEIRMAKEIRSTKAESRRRQPWPASVVGFRHSSENGPIHGMVIRAVSPYPVRVRERRQRRKTRRPLFRLTGSRLTSYQAPPRLASRGDPPAAPAPDHGGVPHPAGPAVDSGRRVRARRPGPAGQRAARAGRPRHRRRAQLRRLQLLRLGGFPAGGGGRAVLRKHSNMGVAPASYWVKGGRPRISSIVRIMLAVV